MKLGILPLGRPTFDVPYAQSKLDAMLMALRATGHALCGPTALLFDEDATKAAISDIQSQGVNQVLILQVTFTDASMTVAIGAAFDCPMSIWAVPEPRAGGRLRLNAFCGLNLASHALSLNDRAFGWLYADPGSDVADDLDALLAGHRPSGRLEPADIPDAGADGQAIASALATRRIACIGEHPQGFDTCAYDTAALSALTGVSVDALPLDDLFDQARAADDGAVAELRRDLDTQVPDAALVDQSELDRSLRLKLGLDGLRSQGGYDAFAIRCWPETFTEYGGAVCGPAGQLNEGQIPCACEADVYGALTQLLLQQVAQAPVFLTDLVDMDLDDNTGVVWHCGQAPMSMRDPDVPASATVHTNRKQPLLYEFTLKPGPVTLARVSQAFGTPKLVLGFGEMLRRSMAYTGTSGVLRFERHAGAVLDDVIASGLEHHMALTYGDHRTALRSAAGAMGLPVLEI